MAGRAAVLSEDDDASGSLDVLEALVSQGSGGNDRPRDTQRQSQSQEAEFEIVEADDDLQPLQQQVEQQTQADQSLEESQDDGTYVGRQQAERQPSKSKQKRQRRQEGRDNTWRELETLRKENEELRQRFSTIEPRLNQMNEGQARAQIGDVERQINENRAIFERAEDQIATAMANNDTPTILQAMRARDKAVIDGQQLLMRRNFLANNLTNMTKEFQAQPQRTGPQVVQTQASPLPMAVQRRVSDFSEAHDWYDPTGRDRDSKIVLMLDNEVAEDGFEMNSPEYWIELEDRMREVLPHRFQEQQQARGQTPGQAPRAAQQQVRWLSAEVR